MKFILVALLLVWLVVALLGALIEGLFWLLVIGLVAFVATAAWGWMKMRTTADRR